MQTQKFDIDSLRIATPCSAGWENMAGDERKRFCEQCRHHVYNISEMTEGQVRALVSASSGRLCGRIYRRADGTVITRDCPVGLRAYRKRAARFAGSLLAAVLGIFSVSFAQTESKKRDEDKETKIVLASTLTIERTRVPHGKGSLTGTITDDNGAVIPGANISLFSGTRGENDDKNKLTTRSNNDGIYSFTGLAAGTYEVEVEAQSFTRILVQELKIEESEQVKLYLSLRPASISVTIGIVSCEPLVDISGSGGKTVITREMLDRMPRRRYF